MSTSELANARVCSESLTDYYRRVRAFSTQISDPLHPEDCVIQSMPDVSPTRWHLAHTTWFFETFVLKPLERYRCFNETYEYLFNSYYNTVGSQFPRSKRGLISRPTLAEVHDYRQHVDSAMQQLLSEPKLKEDVVSLVELGLNHEQQHQELMLTDIKHVLSCNPLYPRYVEHPILSIESTADWAESVSFGEGLYEIGNEGNGFSYDNESPRHRVFVDDFSVGRNLVTCGGFLEFIEDGGYQRPEFWLSAGWQHASEQGWQAPLYWVRSQDQWHQFTLAGLVKINPRLPVCHVSYFEADAFARWAKMRLPTEAEWEVAAADQDVTGNFADLLLDGEHAVHPTNQPGSTSDISQLFGETWEWTASQYLPYPGFQPANGAVGEYNGKFMCNQFVLRGGSCATPSGHIRPSYRNFFPPEARWQFSGIRLAG